MVRGNGSSVGDWAQREGGQGRLGVCTGEGKSGEVGKHLHGDLSKPLAGSSPVEPWTYSADGPRA